MVMLYLSVDTLIWQLSINHNMDIQYQRNNQGNGSPLLFIKVSSLAYGCVDVHTYLCMYVHV